MSRPSSLSILRHTALAEGGSFLLLLCVAMPLKYFADLPMAVKLAGWLHGALFIALCVMILHAMNSHGLTFRRAAIVFIASLLPFGPFVIDGRMKRWEAMAAPDFPKDSAA